MSCPIACICCWAVEGAFKHIALEIVNHIETGKKSCTEVIESLKESNDALTSVFRKASYIMLISGHILLFSPLIALMKWIPLVGFLLGAIVTFAAYVFGFIWGTLLYILVLALAWIVYRPKLGILLLAIVGIGIGLMFI